MEDVVAAIDRALPPGIIREVGDVHRQAIAGLDLRFEHRPDLRLSRRVTHRGANLVAAAQELHQAPAAEESRTAGDQNCFHDAESMSHPGAAAPMPRYAGRELRHPNFGS